MEFDALLLSRLQFAFTIGFHIIFPAFTIGLASFLAVLEGLWLKTKNPVYRNLYLFWVKIFALSFGMGVVSGVVMSYQFGTNWSVFSDKTGPVLGPLMAYEVLTAFFLEAGFLGIMLFGREKVGERLHAAATCIVPDRKCLRQISKTSPLGFIKSSFAQTYKSHRMGASTFITQFSEHAAPILLYATTMEYLFTDENNALSSVWPAAFNI